MQRNYLDFDTNNYYAPVSWLVCTDDIAARAISNHIKSWMVYPTHKHKCIYEIAFDFLNSRTS
jgi:hypothetical protein